ncbi:MAG: mannonate dehydratase [Rhodothermales bacterium]
MKRRDFVRVAAGGSIAAVSAGDYATRRAQGRPAARMKVGCQHGGVTKENLEFLARHGVYHMDAGSPRLIEGVGWDLDDSLRIVDAAGAYGIRVVAYHLPLTSAGIDRVATPHIMLAKDPERDREIEMIQQMIQVAAKSEVRLLLYNTTILPVIRTGRTNDPGRGNSRYSTWNYEEALQRGMDAELTVAGQVDLDELYARITYFLDRVLPVAEEYNVRLGNHIADPPTPIGYRGISRWNSPDVREGIRRFAQLYDSPSHGFNLCLGSTAEGLTDPRTEILPIIEWIGRRGQIFNIHLRNIKGGWNDFQEVWPDNGDMDFVQVIKALRDVGYDGMVMPDHIPQHDDPASALQGHAFCFGYIKALIQAMGA